MEIYLLHAVNSYSFVNTLFLVYELYFTLRTFTVYVKYSGLFLYKLNNNGYKMLPCVTPCCFYLKHNDLVKKYN